MTPSPVNKQSANRQIRKAAYRATSKELMCGLPCLGSPLSRLWSLRGKLTAGHGVSLVPPKHSLLLPSDASPHQLQSGHTLGDSFPIITEVRGPSVQTLNRQIVLGFLPNLCVHLKVHHYQGKNLTCSQTCSVKPAVAVVGVGVWR